MDVIPVLDLSRGVAVHARGGDRESYEPVRSVLLAEDAPADPRLLVRAYYEQLGAERCYVADLDAIQGGPVQRELLRELAAFQTGFRGELLVDAGVAAADGALEVVSCGASDVVVGLETLRSFAELRGTVRLVGADRIVFSVDLRLGAPVLHPTLLDATGSSPDAATLAAQAVEAGVTTVLLLDVGRVGTGCGVDLGVVDVVRRRHPEIELLAGGGVLTRKDLDRMADEGCDGALVASSLHAGRIGAEDVAALRRRDRRAQSPASVSR
jgi:phosphoribosylformimino-5-aminoimidazole carboxamide ribotide isomerase